MEWYIFLTIFISTIVIFALIGNFYPFCCYIAARKSSSVTVENVEIGEEDSFEKIAETNNVQQIYDEGEIISKDKLEATKSSTRHSMKRVKFQSLGKNDNSIMSDQNTVIGTLHNQISISERNLFPIIEENDNCSEKSSLNSNAHVEHAIEDSNKIISPNSLIRIDVPDAPLLKTSEKNDNCAEVSTGSNLQFNPAIEHLQEDFDQEPGIRMGLHDASTVSTDFTNKKCAEMATDLNSNAHINLVMEDSNQDIEQNTAIMLDVPDARALSSSVENVMCADTPECSNPKGYSPKNIQILEGSNKNIEQGSFVREDVHEGHKVINEDKQ